MHRPPAFAWTSGELHADVLLGAGLLAVVYAVAWARGPRRRAGEPLRFFTGLGVLLLALNGPLHDLSDYHLFSAHMV
jgi:predicted membrane protein